MLETFIPTFDYYCRMTINFVGNNGIHLSYCDKGYCLYDISADVEHFFSSKEELVDKAKQYLNTNEVYDVALIGKNSSNETYIF